MGFVDDDPRRRSLRTGFDRAAADYQRTRPVCPPQLFDDLTGLAGLEAGDRGTGGPGDRVIEIGCGTGQATVPLAGRGLAVDPQLRYAKPCRLLPSRSACVTCRPKP